jgi:hypothetical protein
MGDFLDAVLLLSRLPVSQLLSFESAVSLCRSCVLTDASVSSALALLRSGDMTYSLMCACTGELSADPSKLVFMSRCTACGAQQALQ